MINITEKRLNYKQQRDAEAKENLLRYSKLEADLKAKGYLKANSGFDKTYKIPLPKKYKDISIAVEHEILPQSVNTVTTMISMSFRYNVSNVYIRNIDIPEELKGLCKTLIDLIEKEFKLENMGFGWSYFFFNGQDDFDLTDETLKTKCFAVTKRMPFIVSQMKSIVTNGSLRRKRV